MSEVKILRPALLWILWHHQGGSSDIGQAIRRYLGMGEHDHLSAEEVEMAKEFEAWNRRAAEAGQQILGWIGDDPAGHGGGFTQESAKADSWRMKGFRVTPVCEYKPQRPAVPDELRKKAEKYIANLKFDADLRQAHGDDDSDQMNLIGLIRQLLTAAPAPERPNNIGD